MFFFPRAEPAPDSSYNEHQVQTMADGALCREARSVVKTLSGLGNTPDVVALRNTVGKRKAEYLFGRFGTALGWTTLKDAQRFYDDNKNGKGGWYP